MTSSTRHSTVRIAIVRDQNKSTAVRGSGRAFNVKCNVSNDNGPLNGQITSVVGDLAIIDPIPPKSLQSLDAHDNMLNLG